MVPAAGLAENPLRGRLDDAIGSALGDAEAGGVGLAAVAVVVFVEVAIETKPRAQHSRADECSRPISCALQHGGERRRVTEPERRVVTDTVGERLEPRENGRVRRQRHRDGRKCRFESDAALRKAIEHGRQVGRVAVGADAIRAQRVDGDQQHVAARGGAGRHQRGRACVQDKPAGRSHDGYRSEGDQRRPPPADACVRIPERTGCGSGWPAALGLPAPRRRHIDLSLI